MKVLNPIVPLTKPIRLFEHPALLVYPYFITNFQSLHAFHPFLILFFNYFLRIVEDAC